MTDANKGREIQQKLYIVFFICVSIAVAFLMFRLIVVFFHIQFNSSFSTISFLPAYFSFIFKTAFCIWASFAAFLIYILIVVSLAFLLSFSSIGLTTREESTLGWGFFTFTPIESTMNCFGRTCSNASSLKEFKRKLWWVYAWLGLQRVLILAVLMNVDSCSETVCSVGMKARGDETITN